MQDTFPPLSLATPAPPRMRTGLWIALGALIVALTVAVLAWVGIGQYNQLQMNEMRVGYEWNQVINQYTRRADLVPNLVAVVRAFTQHEDDVFSQITATSARLHDVAEGARSGSDPEKVAQFQAAQSQLSAQLGRLLTVAQNYPALTSASLYQDLMVQLEGTENRLAYARQGYFGSLMEYNLGLRRFPGNLLARQAGMQPKQAVALTDERAVRPAAPLNLK